MFRYSCRTMVLVGLLLALTTQAWAHAIVIHAQPTPGAATTGPDIDVTLTFNVRIDSMRSKLTLTNADGATSDIVILPNTSPAVVAGHLAGLSAGTYTIRWQVLATDGHITRGDIQFSVAP